MPQVAEALDANNGNAGGGFYSEGGQFYYVRGLGRLQTLEDIGNVVLAVHDGMPVLVQGHRRGVHRPCAAPGPVRLQGQNDAVEGVMLMRTGEKAQTVLRGVEAKTAELNGGLLPQRREDGAVLRPQRPHLADDRTVEDNLLRGIVLVVVVLVFFLYDLRSGLIVAVTIPLSLLFAFICLDLRHIPANLLSIGAIDFGILVDGAVVMVENIYRRLAERDPSDAADPGLVRTIADAAAEVDRPIFYAVAVIIASFLPIYVLSGPSGRLFSPMADTTIFALIGALIVTLTLLPVLCAWLLRGGVRERRNPLFEWVRGCMRMDLACACAGRGGPSARQRRCSRCRCCSCPPSAPSSCRSWTRARCGCGRPCRTPSRSRSREDRAGRSVASSSRFPRSRWSRRSTAARTTPRIRRASSTPSSSSGSGRTVSGTVRIATRPH